MRGLILSLVLCTVPGTVSSLRLQLSSSTVEHIVIIGVDGMGALYMSDMSHRLPNLAKLVDQRNTYSSFSVQNEMPSTTLPNFATIFTGSGTAVHNIQTNKWRPGDTHPATSIFKVVRDAKPDSTIEMISGSFIALSRLLEPDVLNKHYNLQGDDADIASFAAETVQRCPTLLFVHLNGVDDAGHHHSWGSPTYYRAMHAADAAIGSILKALTYAGVRDKTLVVVVSDHGGIAIGGGLGRILGMTLGPLANSLGVSSYVQHFGHGGDSRLERTVPLIISGPRVAFCKNCDSNAHLRDVAPTVAALARLPRARDWTGTVIQDVFRGSRAKRRKPPSILSKCLAWVPRIPWVYWQPWLRFLEPLREAP
eukprot:gnl/TRDRNA2_/TRDRNA2_39393_c0_seq1.p1 gnl/TRDRNA2_/TRDRNA2_39393_c0~~gnl/TRDRNA2_/TRDRNA2_39393_c0_seq1.p1  ORF type:complete len:366 (-),score=34.60 gnl/TRDRNA2_/TRDRNA2_39393_c0_seq1:11-1108(-)